MCGLCHLGSSEVVLTADSKTSKCQARIKCEDTECIWNRPVQWIYQGCVKMTLVQRQIDSLLQVHYNVHGGKQSQSLSLKSEAHIWWSTNSCAFIICGLQGGVPKDHFITRKICAFLAHKINTIIKENYFLKWQTPLDITITDFLKCQNLYLNLYRFDKSSSN